MGKMLGARARDWYINPNLRKTCPRCSSQNIRDIGYVQDKDGQGTVYRCQKRARCSEQRGMDEGLITSIMSEFELCIRSFIGKLREIDAVKVVVIYHVYVKLIVNRG